MWDDQITISEMDFTGNVRRMNVDLVSTERRMLFRFANCLNQLAWIETANIIILFPFNTKSRK